MVRVPRKLNPGEGALVSRCFQELIQEHQSQQAVHKWVCGVVVAPSGFNTHEFMWKTTRTRADELSLMFELLR